MNALDTKLGELESKGLIELIPTRIRSGSPGSTTGADHGGVGFAELEILGADDNNKFIIRTARRNFFEVFTKDSTGQIVASAGMPGAIGSLHVQVMLD